jgi:hypothetical protein
MTEDTVWRKQGGVGPKLGAIQMKISQFGYWFADVRFEMSRTAVVEDEAC